MAISNISNASYIHPSLAVLQEGQGGSPLLSFFSRAELLASQV